MSRRRRSPPLGARGPSRGGRATHDRTPTRRAARRVDRPVPGHCETVENRVPWSDRRKRTLAGLGAGALVMGLAALALPDEFGATAAVLAALFAFLLVAAVVVFVAVPGPDTLETLSRSVPLAG